MYVEDDRRQRRKRARRHAAEVNTEIDDEAMAPTADGEAHDLSELRATLSSYSIGLKQLARIALSKKDLTRHQVLIVNTITQSGNSLSKRTTKTLDQLDICLLEIAQVHKTISSEFD